MKDTIQHPTQSEEDEALCRRCGACCHEKFILEDVVLITDIPCEYFDSTTNLCTIYETRAEINPRCLSAREAKKLGALPADCPYVQDDPAYVPAVFLRDHPEYTELLSDEIRAMEEEQEKKGS